jgi:alanyl-tRNA synthetase
MQNHSGEHILSGLFHREYGLNNVGFHMGSEDVTLDLDGELTHEQLMRIETMANCIVCQNIPISIDYPAPDVLTALDYRSKLDLRENVRIVSIGENGCVDRCACCAPHVTRTGEIGMIKILDHIRYKGGIRIHMLCGMDALEDYRTRYEAVSAIAASLSAKQKDVVGAVERLCTEIGEEKARQSALCQRLISLHTAALSDGEPAILFEAAFGANDLRRLVNAALEITHTAIALSGDDAAGYTYVLGSRTQACRAVGAEMHAALGGRGGGSDAMVQGRIPATRTEIDQWWKSERL